MSVGDQRDGRTLFLILVEEYSGKCDDRAVAMAAQDAMALNMYTDTGEFRANWQRNNRAYLDSTGSEVLEGMQRRQILEALRPHTHTHTHDRQRPTTRTRSTGRYTQSTRDKDAGAGTNVRRAHGRVQRTYSLRRRRARGQQGRGRLGLVRSDHTRYKEMPIMQLTRYHRDRYVQHVRSL